MQKRHSWVFSMLEANPEGGSEYDVAEALPDFSTAAHKKSVMDVKQWLKTLPVSRRQLCKVMVVPFSPKPPGSFDFIWVQAAMSSLSAHC